MLQTLYLPMVAVKTDVVNLEAQNEVQQAFNYWLSDKIRQFRNGFIQNEVKLHGPIVPDVTAITQALVDVLTHRRFNYQSKKKLLHILPEIRQTMESSIVLGQPIQLMYLYNGGYRASSFPHNLSLNFKPDLTEMMLLYQIALLQRQVRTLYSPGIEFTIVINNGVANRVNDVPFASTENYVQQLRAMIEQVGGQHTVHVLVQSELNEGEQTAWAIDTTVLPTLTEKEHANIERFTGRKMLPTEAALRSLWYVQAEALWFEQLKAIAHSKQAILLRQIADANMLSFRPFPGGAIRVQNGTLGFEYVNNTIRLKLITTENYAHHNTLMLPYVSPFSSVVHEPSYSV